MGGTCAATRSKRVIAQPCGDYWMLEVRMPPRNPQTGVARYAEIQRALETAIFSGDLPPGARVPSEQQLLKRYRCSRMTVNKALSALAASGLIVRRRRT